LNVGETVTLEIEATRHAVHVLRLHPGTTVTLFNGGGGEYRGTLIESSKRGATVAVEQLDSREAESPLRICLAQGISRQERMDFTIQKAVELGVNAIVPLHTERSVVNLQGERLARRHNHWQGVAVSACEQCGRNRIPEIHLPRELLEWLPLAPPGKRLLLDPEGEVGQNVLTNLGPEVILLIGPEGGLSASERQQALDADFIAMRLGPRILRTETAALASLAVLQARGGDLAG
jgi:16S rRNA (uracil1498-N3)-methyltransferase